SVIGSRAVVSAGAWVVDSVLLPGAVVSPGSVVEDSIVGEGAMVGEEAHVRATLLGCRADVPPGARVTDVRLPDDDARGSPELGPRP
ncbi:MAG: NDP-sugar synthase, partial [Acidimicrobiales bacterium]